MIKVFALEPGLVVDSLLIQRLEQFGFDQGRIIGEVPKNWREEIKSAVQQADPKQRKSLEIRLERLLKDRAVQRLPFETNENTWIATATNVPRNCLDGIIVGERGDSRDERILEGNDHFGESEVWNVSTNFLSSRDEESMAKHVAVLMRYAYEVKFADPYFSGEPRHLEFFKQCLIHRRDWPLKARLNLEFHFRWRRNSPADDNASLRIQSKDCFASTVKLTINAIRELLRNGDSIGWYQWAEREDENHQRFHERYVLTDLGGVEFGGGLDTGNPSQQTSVNLLSKATVQTLNRRFSKGSDEFELLHCEETKL
jgi:hypothetical protein